MGYLNVWENVVAYFKTKENWEKTYLLADVVISCLYLEAMKKMLNSQVEYLKNTETFKLVQICPNLNKAVFNKLFLMFYNYYI